MAVAAPARKAAPAPAPSRTTAPPKPAPSRKRPLRPTRTSVVARGSAAPARKKPGSRTAAPTRKKPAARAQPARKAPARKAPARKVATRTAASRTRSAARAVPQRAVAGGQLIPLAVGRTAVAVRQLPDSGLVVRMTRGRAWIGVLGMLLVGIVALNVVTLSFAASSGQIDEEIVTLEREIGVTANRDAQRSGMGRVRSAAAAQGLAMPASDQIHFVEVGPGDVATAAQRLAAAGG